MKEKRKLDGEKQNKGIYKENDTGIIFACRSWISIKYQFSVFPSPLFPFALLWRQTERHSWMWPTHKTLKTHVESLLPITGCVTLADYIYFAIFRKHWPRPVYYATKHTLIFAQLIFDVYGPRRHFPNRFVVDSSFMLHLWNIFWRHFRPKGDWESIRSCTIFKGHVIHLGCLQEYTVHCIF